MTEIHTHIDSQGHSYIVDGETVWAAVKGTTTLVALTREEARIAWADSARVTAAQAAPRVTNPAHIVGRFIGR